MSLFISKKNPNPKGVALAILQTKMIHPNKFLLTYLKNALVATMLSGKISTIRTDKRAEQLKEIKLSQQLGTDLSAANLKSQIILLELLLMKICFAVAVIKS